jgi:hypothetical protein
LTARQTALTRENIAEENRLAQEKINLQKQIAEAEANTIDEKRDLQLQKEQEKYDALIEQAEANNLNTDELELSRDQRLLEMRQQFADEDDAIKAKSVEEQAKLEQVFKQRKKTDKHKLVKLVVLLVICKKYLVHLARKVKRWRLQG